MFRYQQTDVNELRRRANDNLIALKGSAARRRMEAEDRAERVAREKLAAARERAEKKAVRQELKELTKLCNHFDRKLTKGTLTEQERGAYEEVDARREQLMEELDPYVWSR